MRFPSNRVRGLTLVLAGWLFLPFSGGGQDAGENSAAEAARTAIAVEALMKLHGADLEANPRLKTAVLKVLAHTRGTSDFVTLVKQFKLGGQSEGLLECAVRNPADEHGVEAMRLILEQGGEAMIQEVLRGTNTAVAVPVAEALGHTGSKQAVTLLRPLVLEKDRDVMLRKQAARSLARTEEGARALLQQAKDGLLPDDVKFTAGAALSAVRWPSLKAEAAELFPAPQGSNNETLPPLAELLARTGDPASGAKVFAAELVQCAVCHRVRGQGGDVGPDLSEIGTKLGKEALYESILDPSAGVSFGYEAFELTMKDGDEAFGLIVSDTLEEVAVKDTRGIVTRYKKSDVRERRQMKLSIMPAGLQMGMTTQELVDLVEFLASLKKP